MILENHLLYIDITQICGIGCTFCMYSDKHKVNVSMDLTEKAKKNIKNLLNSSSLKRVSISGEGEPLNNIKNFKEILNLSKGDISFEFITSGFIPHEKLAAFYDDINGITIKNNDTCNIRLSSDSYHIAKIKHKPHGFSIKYLLEKNPNNISFSFRSIDTDKKFTRSYLLSELERLDIKGRIEIVNTLEDKLFVGNKEFNIDYKNLVNPHLLIGEYLNLESYIKAIEEKTGKVFTLGSINKKPLNNGMDITIKPNGDIFFYGIENIRLGNIHSDDVTLDLLSEKLKSNHFFRTLYTTPFIEIIDQLSTNPDVKKIIEKTNNPYWIIKEIFNYDKDFLYKIIAL